MSSNVFSKVPAKANTYRDTKKETCIYDIVGLSIIKMDSRWILKSILVPLCTASCCHVVQTWILPWGPAKKKAGDISRQTVVRLNWHTNRVAPTFAPNVAPTVCIHVAPTIAPVVARWTQGVGYSVRLAIASSSVYSVAVCISM